MALALASDQEFLDALHQAISLYFSAVDNWESVYRRYYRMPGTAQPSGDLEAEQREFEDRRRELEQLLPRARLLCFKQGRPDVFAGLAYVSLGRYAPQQRTDSAIGRGERRAVMDCLIELNDACREPEAEPPASAAADQTTPKPSLLGRLLAFLY
jgi:hypothetical protein